MSFKRILGEFMSKSSPGATTLSKRIAPDRYKVTPKLLQAFERKRIYTTAYNSEKSWLRTGTIVSFTCPVLLEPYTTFRAGPGFFPLGAFSYSRSNFPETIKIGRYAALGLRTEIMGLNHPMERLSMVGFDYSKRDVFKIAREDFDSNVKIVRLRNRKLKTQKIGNDVWIGNDVLLARNIKIGNGAVIAARSIVTRDVPPYAVVAGSPAKIKKYRFADELVERLCASKWWEYSFTSFENLDTTNVELFLNEFEKRIASGDLTPWNPEKISINEVFEEYAKKIY